MRDDTKIKNLLVIECRLITYYRVIDDWMTTLALAPAYVCAYQLKFTMRIIKF